MARIMNSRKPAAILWNVERMRQADKRFVRDGLLDNALLVRAPPSQKEDRILVIIAAIKNSVPDMKLKEIAARFKTMRKPTPPVRSKWATSSVADLLERTRQAGLLEDRP